MTQQATLFDWSMAAQEMAIATVAAHNESWVAMAVAYVKRVALAQRWLTTDDVWPLIPGGDDELGSFRAIGPVMRQAKREGYIRTTGQTRPCHCGRHRMPVRIWESLIFEGGDR